MSDKPTPETPQEPTIESDATLPVPPPNFKERLAAAQRARLNLAQRSTQIKVPPTLPDEPEPGKDNKS